MKTKEELNELKNEYETLTTKLQELSEDELDEVTGGVNIWDIGVKLKERFNTGLLGSNQEGNELSFIGKRGKNGKPTMPLWDNVCSEFSKNTEQSSGGAIYASGSINIPLDSDQKLK